MCASLVITHNAGSSGNTASWQHPGLHTGWRSVVSVEELPDLVDKVVGIMKRLGYGRRDKFAVHLALEEATVNAVKHGHQFDPHKQVRIWWAVTAADVRLIVQDEGPGFDPTQVPDPRLPEHQERTSGRGLLLISSCMSWVRHNRRGNCIIMCLRRAEQTR
jgi:serine/threonine-protein kinase RsbW